MLGPSKLRNRSISHLLLHEVLGWCSWHKLPLVVTLAHQLLTTFKTFLLRKSCCHLGVHSFYCLNHLRLVKLLLLLFHSYEVSVHLGILGPLSRGTGHIINISLSQILRKWVLLSQSLVRISSLFHSVALFARMAIRVKHRLAHITSIHIALSSVKKNRIILKSYLLLISWLQDHRLSMLLVTACKCWKPAIIYLFLLVSVTTGATQVVICYL